MSRIKRVSSDEINNQREFLTNKNVTVVLKTGSSFMVEIFKVENGILQAKNKLSRKFHWTLDKVEEIIIQLNE